MVGEKTGAKVGAPALREDNLRVQLSPEDVRFFKDAMPLVCLINQHCERGGCVIIEKRREA
ncbi:hypothetical protein MUP38_04460 [Candidatus Bathyarchaeota archaeon]|nr:hypothetical protein [Candidatus Bathyarchaeota archaeon]